MLLALCRTCNERHRGTCAEYLASKRPAPKAKREPAPIPGKKPKPAKKERTDRERKRRSS
jgi:hypothetical protein